jgi:hypothetical protein
MPMTTNHPIAVAVVLLLLLMLPLPARRLSAASGPPAREKKKKTCSVAVVERDTATHSTLCIDQSRERERDVYVCTKKSLFFVNFGFFAAALGMMTRKPIKINRSSFLTVVFLDVKLYNTRKKKNKKNRARSSSLPLCLSARGVVVVSKRGKKRERKVSKSLPSFLSRLL